MLESKAKRFAAALLAALIVVLVVAAAALYGEEGDNQTVNIVPPTPDAINYGTAAQNESSRTTLRETELRVYVSGAVRRPGVYLLNPGDRLEDALEAAGGGTSEADFDAINLAIRVQDEAHYRVPSIGEPPDAESNTVAEPVDLPDPSGDSRQPSTVLIDLNTAPVELLESLPGIGPVRAKAIVADREQNGRFLTIEQITRVPGIGAATYKDIRDLVVIDSGP